MCALKNELRDKKKCDSSRLKKSVDDRFSRFVLLLSIELVIVKLLDNLSIKTALRYSVNNTVRLNILQD